MADMAANQRRFAETLQLKERGEALKSIAAKPIRFAGRQAKAMWRIISGSRAFGFAKGLLAGAWSFTVRQAGRLGRVGCVAAVVTAVTSERGQKVIGKVVGTVARVVDAVSRCAINVIGRIPFVGKTIERKLTAARHWVWDKALDFTAGAQDNVIVKAAMHDGIVSRNVRLVAAPYAGYKLAGLLPGGWKLVGYTVWAVWLLRAINNSHRISGMVADVISGTIKESKPKVDLNKTKASKAASAADQAKFDKFVAKADTTVEHIDTVLADNEAHESAAAELDQAELEHRTEAYEKGKAQMNGAYGHDVETEAEKRQRISDELDMFEDGMVEYTDPETVESSDPRWALACVIAAATRKYFAEADNPALSLSKRDQALKALVIPGFRQAGLVDEKAADAAAYQYAKRQVRAYRDGEFPYDEGSIVEPNVSFALKQAQVDAVLNEMHAKDVAAAKAGT